MSIKTSILAMLRDVIRGGVIEPAAGPAPAPPEYVNKAIGALCDAVDVLAERVEALEGHELLAQELARWAARVNDEHPCTGAGCWWCRERDAMARRVLEAGEVTEPKPRKRTKRKPRKGRR